jgi:hypothetical protein
MKFFSVLVILVILLIIPAVCAQVQYPVQELGNCASQQDCEKYCEDIQNSESCLDFAEKSGMMTKEEIDEARKVLPYLKSGETPGKCNSGKACDEYCNKDENLQECIAFAEKAGLITGEELAIVKKTGGKGPGGCKGKKQCDDYCNDETHFSECVDFAVQNGLMDASEAEIVKKTGGKGPGGCKGKEECDAFCNNEANFPTCVDFAVANGLMDAKDAEMAKKTGGKGPGGCKSEEACTAFCNNPDNQETCMNFGIEHGLIPPEDLEKMKKNQEFMNTETGQCYSQCLKDAGIDFKDCPEGGGGPDSCKSCQDKCFSHDNKNCLSQERWQQLNQDCQAKGSGYHLEEVRGSDGQGGECVTDETCVYSSGEEWESQEEKDRKLAEMEAQWARERAEYEARSGPGSQGTETYTGGCTEPGPEGQCNPGPGAGPEPGSEGGGSGGQTGDSSGGSDSSGSSSGDSGGEQVAGTGAVIMRTSSNGVITRLAEYTKNLF